MTDELHDGARYFDSASEVEPSAEPSDSWSRYSEDEKTSSDSAFATQSNSKAAAKNPAEALDAIRGTLGTEIRSQGQTLPSQYYSYDDVEYFPASPAPSKGVGGPGPGLIAGAELAESSGPAAGSGAGVASGVAGMGMGGPGSVGKPKSGFGPGGNADFGDRDGLAAGSGAIAGNDILTNRYGMEAQRELGEPDISKFGVPSRAAPSPANPKSDSIALLNDGSASMEMPPAGGAFRERI